MQLKLFLALLMSFAVTAVTGRFLIPWLKSVKAGQKIKEIGPRWHKSKEGTPTMGGLMFIFGILIACFTIGFSSVAQGCSVHIYLFVFALVFGAIGFLDDWEKLRHKQNKGLSGWTKLFLQILASLIFVYIMKQTGYASQHVYLPYFNITFDVPLWLYYFASVFIIVGTVNAVNLTDGIDGLAAGSSVPVFAFFIAAALKVGDAALEPGIFASAAVGGLLGFLVYNFNPARVFMGDTGSLFLGGAVAALSFAFDMPLILITLGIVYIIEALSDIIQVGYFKLSHGKRVFKMAPFHHHLEMGGWSGKKWSEREIFVLFTAVAAVFAVLSFIGVQGKL